MDEYKLRDETCYKCAHVHVCLENIFEISQKFDVTWSTMGRKSKDGHPHHPLYLKKGLDFEYFDIDNYIKELINNEY